MKKNPLVSIITVCLNSEKFLEQTIKSVIDQTYGNIEYIIIDGFSSDNTILIIQKYENFLKYWVSEPDQGIYDAMNKGISHVSGTWVGIINSDDWYHPRAAEWVVMAAAENSKADLIYGDVINVEEDGTFRRGFGSDENLLENPALPHPSCFVRKEIYDHFKYDIKFPINADYEFFLRLKKEHRTFVHLEAPIAFFRRSGISNKPAFKPVVDRYVIRKRYDMKKAKKIFFFDMIRYADDVIFAMSKQLGMTFEPHNPTGFRMAKKVMKIAIGPVLRFAKNHNSVT